MVAPIIVRNPLLHLQPLTDEGADDGALVDVSCDMASVEIGIDTPTRDVTTFCGTFSIPEDPSVTGMPYCAFVRSFAIHAESP